MASITLSLIARPPLTSSVVLIAPKRQSAPAETVAERDTDALQMCLRQSLRPARPGPAQDPPRRPTTTPHDLAQTVPPAPPTPPGGPSGHRRQRMTAPAAAARGSAPEGRARDPPRAADWQAPVAPPQATT